MLNFVYYVTAALLLLMSCKSSVQIHPELKMSNGYFATFKSDSIFTSTLTKEEFYQKFEVAVIMSKMPTFFDFEKETVCVIMLPETAYSTEIELDEPELIDNVLYIGYSIKKGEEKQSFTFIPTQIFTFDKSPQIKSVSFKNVSL